MFWESVGEAVADRRKALGLSQHGLAQLCGISRGTVRNVEGGTVEANDNTTIHLENVLGWRHGTIAALDNNEPPVEVVPDGVLAAVLPVLADRINGDPDERAAAHRVHETLIGIIQRSSPDGTLGDVEQIGLLDLIDGLDAFDLPREQIEGLYEEAEYHFASYQNPPPRKTLQQIRSTFEGARIHHEQLGEGIVVHVDQNGADTVASVDFDGATGVRDLKLRYEPYHIMGYNARPAPNADDDAQPPEQADPAALPEALRDNLAKLGQDANQALRDGDVVDAITTEAFGTTGLTVITALIRAGGHPLGGGERRYIADFLRASTSTDLYLRMYDGEIIDLNRPKPQ